MLAAVFGRARHSYRAYRNELITYKKMRNKRLKICIFLCFFAVLAVCLTVTSRAEDGIDLPDDYKDFLDSLDPDTSDKLPDGVFSSDTEDIYGAAQSLSDARKILSALLEAFSSGLSCVLPRLAVILAIVIISALCYSVSSYCSGGLSRAVDVCVRLCSFCALSGVAISCAESVKLYFERLFCAMSSFIPLGAAMYAMGGNLTGAASSAGSLAVTLTVCEFICGYTVIPVFSMCLCMSLLGVFGGVSGNLGGTVSASVRKWYTTAMAFVMMILTGAITSQSILSAKADNVAMKGVKFAASSFVPLFGGSLSGTLGTLSSSVELLRGSVGIIGIAAIFLMLLPVIIELALMRTVFSIGAFCAGMIGCSDEQRIMNDIGSLYGYLEGAALMCSAVFVIALGIFAASVTPFS